MSTKTFVPKPVKKSFWGSVHMPPGGQGLFEAIDEGFEFDVIEALAKTVQVEKSVLAEAIQISPSTLARRARQHRFSAPESDRLYQVAETYKAALDLFEGDERAAQAWMKRPNKGLFGKPPLMMMRTAAQVKSVQQLIHRLEHGIIT